MARKSPWQQFSDNFSSVYGTFQDLGRGLETSRVMNEKPEEEMVQEGPRNSYQRATGKYTYGGKTYDKEITPDELRGLQYNRLGDVMAKYGDPTGAMQMRTSAANIESSRASLEAQQTANEIALGTKEAVIKLASLKNANLEANTANTIGNTGLTKANLDLMRATMGDKVAQETLKTLGLQWDNKSKEYKAIVEEATMQDKIDISGISVERAQVDLANEKLKGEGYRIDNDGNLIQLGVDRATQKDKITMSGLEVEGKKQSNINAALYGTGLKLDNRGKLVSAEIDEATQESSTSAIEAKNRAIMDTAAAESTSARLENNANLNLTEYSQIMKDGGEFTNRDGQKVSGVEWLRENWTGDEATKKVIDRLEDDELNTLMRDGSVMMKSVEGTLTGTTSLGQVKDKLEKLIDDQDSIPGNVKISQGEGGAVFLLEKDADGNIVNEIKGKDYEEFKQNLLSAMSPMRAITMAKANADVALVEAQVAELKKVGLDEGDVEKLWLAHYSATELSREEFGQEPLTIDEITQRKLRYYQGAIADAKAKKSGISNGDGGWSSTQI